MTIVNVYVEMEPHSEDLTGVVLNRPAPRGGVFLVDQRLPGDVWQKMKAAGAWYWSRDDLEVFDMFQASPGWRYGIEAIAALIESGYAVRVRGEVVTTQAALQALFTEEAKVAYRTRVEEERRRREAEEEDRRRAKEKRAALKGAAYEEWQAQKLAGLVKTFARPAEDAEWVQVAYFDKDTPGAWYTTGDTWYTAQIGGQTVCKREYGNAVAFFAPRELVDEWCRGHFEWYADRWGEPAAARWVLEMSASEGVIGADIARRLVEMDGVERYREIARREPWLIFELSGLMAEREAAVARAHGLEPVIMEPISYYDFDVLHGLVHPTLTAEDGRPHKARSLWKHPDGSIYAYTYYGTWFRLDPEDVPAGVC